MEYIESNRIGKFEVSFGIINNIPLDIKLIMAECIVIWVELFSFSGRAVYTAISDRFDEVLDGNAIPFYIWHLTNESDNNGHREVRIKGCEKTNRIVY